MFLFDASMRDQNETAVNGYQDVVKPDARQRERCGKELRALLCMAPCVLVVPRHVARWRMVCVRALIQKVRYNLQVTSRMNKPTGGARMSIELAGVTVIKTDHKFTAVRAEAL